MRLNSPTTALFRHVTNTAAGLFLVPLLTMTLLLLITIQGALRLPGGYDGSGGLNALFGLLAVIWALSFATRCVHPQSKLAAAIEATALLIALGFAGSLATAALAIDSGPYIDPALVAIDRFMVPFMDWRDLALGLPAYPWLQAMLSQFYVALNWQAFLFIGVALVIGSQKDMDSLLTATCFGSLLCILPLPLIPAVGPYPFYAIGAGEVPGASVGLPWHSVGRIEGLRSGAIDTLSSSTVSGLVTIPSFHACSAVILGWAFWRYSILRWPMAIINFFMFIAAVPIGGHYFIDVVAGGGVAIIAIAATRSLERRREDRATAVGSFPEGGPVNGSGIGGTGFGDISGFLRLRFPPN